MVARRFISALLSILMLLPSTALAAGPVTSPPEVILTEGFESTTPTQYTTAPWLVGDAWVDGKKYWGRITRNKRSGTAALWCNGSPTAPTSWPTNYANRSSGIADFTVPALADFYSAQVSFYYNMPSLGLADTNSFSLHWWPVGETQPSAVYPFAKTTTAAPWKYTTHDLASDSSKISREPGVVRLQWVDKRETGDVSPFVGVGPTVDDLTIAGWRYGPPRFVQAEPAHRSVAISWQKPYAAVDGSVLESRAVVYDVWRRPTSDPNGWTLVEPMTAATSLADSGLSPATGYTYAVQARDVDGPGFGQSVSVAATTTNASPEPATDSYTVAEDTPLTVSAPGVLSNDSDSDGDLITAERVTGPSHGTLSLSTNGSFTYTPQADYNGPDSFTYKAKDLYGGWANATVNITVTPVNDAPVAMADTSFVAEDTTLTVAADGLLDNDTDVEGAVLTAWLYEPPSHGSVTVNSDGSYAYRPAVNFNGTDSFLYRAYDGLAYSTPVTVTITVTAVNDAPVGVSDAYNTAEDTPLNTVNVLTNDTDVEGNTLTATILTQPASGTLQLNANGSFTYQPAPNFNGIVSFTYRAYDGQAYSAPVTVTITVTPVNDAPVAVANASTVAEDTTLSVAAPGLLGNDTDVDSAVLTASVATQPSHGSVTVNSDGSYVYHPAANYSGTDSFTYRVHDGQTYSTPAAVTITVTAVNDPPVAVADMGTVNEDATRSVAAPGLLGNDTDVDGAELTASVVSQPSHGSVTINSDGSYVYRPAANYNGSDSFTYRAHDGAAYSAPVTVTITVTPVNDAPVAVADFVGARPNQLLIVPASSGVLVNDSDVDGDLLTAELVAGTAHGTVVLQPNGSYTYDPGPGFVTTDFFTYRATDAEFDSAVTTVLITANNSAPVARDDSATTPEDQVLEASSVLVNDEDGDGDSLHATLLQGAQHGSVLLRDDGTFRYTPSADYNGSDRFTYRAFDGAAYSDPATVTVQVTGVNDAPVAVADEYSVNEDQALTVLAPLGVLANDFDIDSAPLLAAVLVSGPASGNLSLNANGTIVYTPATNFTGTVTFTYRASDGALTSPDAVVTIVVRPVNDAPVGIADEFTDASEDTLYPAGEPGVLGNDTDVEGDPLTAVPLGSPISGDVAINEDGSFTYVPDRDFYGDDVFSYLVFDGANYSQPVSVTIKVAPANDAPVAYDDEATTEEDKSIEIDVLGNDTDVDDASLTADVAVQPSHGSIAAGPNGSLVYQPAANYNGADSFTYRASDGEADSATVTVTIAVTAVNDAPVAGDDGPVMVARDSSVTVPAPGVLSNDTDVDDDDLNAVLWSGPAHGRLSLAADGGFTYTPDEGFVGDDSFAYRASDGRDYSSPMTVTLQVTESAGVVTRIAGYDRYAVAEALARRGWDPAGDRSWPKVTDVIVANGENGKEADPLAAAGLAGAYDAPVLLVQSTRIPNQTRRALTEIALKNPGVRVHVIGGKVTVPPARWTEIKAIPGVSQTDNRVEGRDRYDVTAIIAQRMVSKLGTTGVSGALIINVENSAAFYDALAVSPQAYAGNWAMLGVRAGSVPSQVAAVLNGSLAGKPRHVVNAAGFVGSAVYTGTGATARYSTTTDRYASAPQIADKVTANSSCSSRETAIAAMLPDALTGGVFLGRQGGVMLFTDSSTAIRTPAKNYISLHGDGIAQGWVLGGEKSVPLAQETAFAGLID